MNHFNTRNKTIIYAKCDSTLTFECERNWKLVKWKGVKTTPSSLNFMRNVVGVVGVLAVERKLEWVCCGQRSLHGR